MPAFRCRYRPRHTISLDLLRRRAPLPPSPSLSHPHITPLRPLSLSRCLCPSASGIRRPPFRRTSTVRRAQLEIHGGKKRRSVTGVSETRGISLSLSLSSKGRVYTRACNRHTRVVTVTSVAEKQACAFFNSNALGGKRWGYNEVPACPPAMHRVELVRCVTPCICECGRARRERLCRYSFFFLSSSSSFTVRYFRIVVSRISTSCAAGMRETRVRPCLRIKSRACDPPSSLLPFRKRREKHFCPQDSRSSHLVSLAYPVTLRKSLLSTDFFPFFFFLPSISKLDRRMWDRKSMVNSNYRGGTKRKIILERDWTRVFTGGNWWKSVAIIIRVRNVRHGLTHHEHRHDQVPPRASVLYLDSNSAISREVAVICIWA